MKKVFLEKVLVKQKTFFISRSPSKTQLERKFCLKSPIKWAKQSKAIKNGYLRLKPMSYEWLQQKKKVFVPLQMSIEKNDVL